MLSSIKMRAHLAFKVMMTTKMILHYLTVRKKKGYDTLASIPKRLVRMFSRKTVQIRP